MSEIPESVEIDAAELRKATQLICETLQTAAIPKIVGICAMHIIIETEKDISGLDVRPVLIHAEESTSSEMH